MGGGRLLFGMGLALLIFIGQSQAATLIWDSSPGEVTGYNLYYGRSAGNYIDYVNVGNQTKYPLEKLPLTEKVLYYLSVSAYNSAGESSLSIPIAYTPPDSTPPTPPVGLSIR